jgi:ATP-binding cassette subfamily B (MDR/TAP) protein 1
MAVFWACLMAATNLQLCIPQFIILSRGKFALASLLALVDAEKDAETQAQIPCHEEITLQDISFAYPSRPAQPILRAVTLVFPAHQTTFVVGASGSGKSTIAHLLAGLYAPQAGALLADGRATDPRALDVAVVGQGQAHALLCDMSVHDNVALGRRAGGVGRAEVEAACARVRMHEFVRGLPGGYDTLLGQDGIASLSGGQAQRLALARAMLRDPDVLVLGTTFIFSRSLYCGLLPFWGEFR